MTGSVEQIWRAAWEKEIREQETSSGIPASSWRAAGRKTKEKPNGESVEFWAEEGLRQVTSYAEWLTSNPDWQIASGPSGEPLVEFSLSGWVGDVFVKGFADAVFAAPMLIQVDYKTGTRPQAGPQQLALYSVLMEGLGMEAPEWGAFFNTRKGELSPVENLTHWDRAWWEKQFARLIAGKTHEIYLPSIGDHCRSCGVSRFCYAVGGAESHVYDPDNPSYAR